MMRRKRVARQRASAEFRWLAPRLIGAIGLLLVTRLQGAYHIQHRAGPQAALQPGTVPISHHQHLPANAPSSQIRQLP